MATAFTEEMVDVGGAKIQMLKGGSGEPLVLLHGAGGNSGWLNYVQALSEKFTVYLPSHPGYGKSDRPEWLETMADLASFYTWFLEEQGLEGTRAIGFSMGGWLASEIAANCRHAFSKLMLVDAAGIQPKQGEIADIFIISPAQVTELLFHDPKQAPEYESIYGGEPTPEQTDIAERNREMSVRICWKPYMYDLRLPGLLSRVSIPTRIVWGANDRLIPLECGQMFNKAIPGSDLVVINDCGHVPQLEKTEEFVKTALEFF
jgi:pimeloyl-ACP methyl ester carboxylesterase